MKPGGAGVGFAGKTLLSGRNLVADASSSRDSACGRPQHTEAARRRSNAPQERVQRSLPVRERTRTEPRSVRDRHRSGTLVALADDETDRPADLRLPRPRARWTPARATNLSSPSALRTLPRGSG